jgi:hypothetical protein
MEGEKPQGRRAKIATHHELELLAVTSRTATRQVFAAQNPLFENFQAKTKPPLPSEGKGG